MDITRGNLDEISRPASSSRAHLGSRASSASLEVLTPEPCLSKVDYQGDLDSDHKQDNSGKSSPEGNQYDSRVKYKTQKMSTLQQTMEEETTCIFQQMQNSELSEYISSSDSGEDCVETEPPNLNKASQEQSSNVKEEVSEEKDVDPKIEEAIRKMNKLDKILAKKQSQERTIKKQGREMRTKLWEELQCVITLSASGSHEEIENTNTFLALTSSLHERADCQNEMETGGLFNKAEKSHYGSDTRIKKNQDFIKKNIELAKDSGNQVVMLEEEKKRLIELLKDTEDGNELQDTEEDTSGWLVAGEGYTPEPMEFHHLNEIAAKLQIIVSNGDFSIIHSSCSNVPSQIYQRLSDLNVLDNSSSLIWTEIPVHLYRLGLLSILRLQKSRMGRQHIFSAEACLAQVTGDDSNTSTDAILSQGSEDADFVPDMGDFSEQEDHVSMEPSSSSDKEELVPQAEVMPILPVGKGRGPAQGHHGRLRRATAGHRAEPLLPPPENVTDDDTFRGRNNRVWGEKKSMANTSSENSQRHSP
ncbi:fibrous sheath-interacting protein 1 isoform X5 [Alligator mississippiensis]|uniref:fibrous sheath-interacting protein 1 isoform X5 n=1 Tax=Alligator mississippiensis TaxID=8496 RepID=UPI002877BEFD|nr:fibrous sheath-interacting protein 1 isoform X5 [Alligator mississippiensis]